MPRAVAFFGVMLGLLLSASGASPPDYASPTDGFTIDLPDGWMPKDPGLAEPMEGFTGVVGQHAQYEIAFIRSDQRSIELPYAAVQCMPGAVDPRDLEQEAARLQAKKVDVSPRFRGLKVNATNPQASFDRIRQRLTMSYTLKAPDGPTIYVTSFTFVGRNGVTKLQCFTDSANLNMANPAFGAMGDGFAYAKGFEYVAPAGGPPVEWDPKLIRDVGTVIFLFIIAVVLVVVLRKSVQV